MDLNESYECEEKENFREQKRRVKGVQCKFLRRRLNLNIRLQVQATGLCM
jgi:hypothetical protein